MKILTLLFLGLVFESAGIVLIFPILSFIEIGGDISQFDSNSTIWGPIIALHRLIGVDIQLISLLFLALASFLLSGSFVYLKTVYIDRLRFRALAASRKKYFEKIFQSKLSLIEDNAHGVLVNEIITDLERALNFVFSVITCAFNSMVIALYVGIILFLSAPVMTIIAPLIILSIAASRYINSKSVGTGKRITSASSSIVKFFVEKLESARLVKLSGTEIEETHQIQKLLGNHSTQLLAASELKARLHLCTEILLALNILTFIYVGFVYLEYDFSQMGIFVAAIIRFVPKLRELLTSIQTMKIHSGSLNVVLKRFRQASEMSEIRVGERYFSN